ncbi:AAA family ATPase [Solimicrobium silvestre]|uniref:Putative kinase n=1 Tax=Solimicrobium silvestre TaxID=2099400 RepID=A0A2S9GSD3_9BURK|nr:ATP-binding protein [Solimicrobium silvestre]PRC90623.1 putative kinase [Solimicrobium silvestre]
MNKPTNHPHISIPATSTINKEQNTSPRPPRIHLVIGPVGAGKSTFALQLGQDNNAIRLNLDDWMAELFRPDRPDINVMEWYIARTKRCIEQIWKITLNLIGTGADVVLEIGLIQQRDREALYARIDEHGIDLAIYVLDAPRDIRRKRVCQRNAEKGETFSMEVPMQIFELASDMWEPPTEAERSSRSMYFLVTE